MVFCRGCGKSIHETAKNCLLCGAVQGTRINDKSRVTAAVLAFFIGSIGLGLLSLHLWLLQNLFFCYVCQMKNLIISIINKIFY
jgi:hypothetical protein